MSRRNYGIDVIRIFAMFCVVLIHNLGRGGVIHSHDLNGLNWFIAWSLESFGIVAVNLFAMITGYLMIARKVRWNRVGEILVQTVFWSVVVSLLLKAMGFPISLLEMMQNPISGFWYVNAYLAVMFVAPFINNGVRSLTKQYYQMLIIALLIVCGTLGFVNDFFLLSGYSGYWLIVMYLVGGYINLFQPKPIRVTLIASIVVTLVITVVSEFMIMRIGMNPSKLCSYVSPLVIFQSIAIFLLLYQTRIHNIHIRRILKFSSPLMFGVFLIDNSLFNKYVLNGLFKVTVAMPAGKFLVFTLLGSLGLFVLFMFLDYLRLTLFRVMNISEHISSLLHILTKRFDSQ